MVRTDDASSEPVGCHVQRIVPVKKAQEKTASHCQTFAAQSTAAVRTWTAAGFTEKW